MAGLLSNAMSGIGGLLGNPRTKQALLASFASGGDPYATGQIVMARQQQDADAERERKMEEYRQIQLEAARRANEEAQKRQAQEIISRTVVNHFAENPNAVAFGGPGATQQQQLAGLLGRGVDASVAGGLIQAGAGPKPTREQQLYQAAQADPQGFGRFLQEQTQNASAAPYNTPVMTADGVYTYNNRTGRMEPAQGGQGVVPLTGDPTQQAEIIRSKKIAEQNAAFEQAVVQNAPKLQSSVGRLGNLLTKVEQGDTSTGVIVGGVLKLADPDTALLEAESIVSSIEALNGSGLAPVSNKELDTIREMFASANKTKTINVALLKRALATAQKQYATLQSQDAYFREKGSIEGWRPEGFTKEQPPSITGPSQAQGNAEAERAALRAKYGIR